MSTLAKRRGWLLLALCAGAWAMPTLDAGVARAQSGFEFSEDRPLDSDDYEEEPAAEEETPEGGESEVSEDEAADGVEPAAAGEDTAEVSFQAFAGAGVGTRSFRRPIKSVDTVQRMDDIPFLALDLGLRVIAWPHETFSLEFLLRYLTSVGMRVEQPPRFALPNDISIRAGRLELSAAPEFHLGSTASSAALLFPVGFAIRTLWPEVHTLPVPGYTLGGPMLRAELAIPFLDVVTLRFGPEAQWMFMIDQSIVDDGVEPQAVAIGGEALLRVQVSTLIGIELAFRESHAIALTRVAGENFVDIERYLTARLSGTW